MTKGQGLWAQIEHKKGYSIPKSFLDKYHGGGPMKGPI
jgi:hypothetical protein